MKKENNYRYPYFATCSLVFAALIGLGASEIGIPVKTFYAVLVDNNNTKWFLTELGIISFAGERWTLHNENSKIATKDLKDFAYRNKPGGAEFWIVSPNGATVTSLPFDVRTEATSYLAETGSILSNNVVKVTIGNDHLRWFGTDKGIAALIDNKWLTPSYEDMYPQMLFKEYRITSMATNPDGDSLYVGTEGAGVARVFRNDVDGISGASVYAQWGPIIIPSDKVYSIFIAPDGTKWFGTDQGVASHTGNNTLENWTVYTTEEGLVNNFVQAIIADKEGNLWFGTKGGGISVFDGSKWTSYTTNDGLNSNNILCLAVDRQGLVWIGTDSGVTAYSSGNFITYR